MSRTGVRFRLISELGAVAAKAPAPLPADHAQPKADLQNTKMD